MPCAAKVSMAETHDGIVLVLVAGAILVDTFLVLAVHVVWYGVSLGTELHQPKRDARPWEGMSHTVGADDRVYVLK